MKIYIVVGVLIALVIFAPLGSFKQTRPPPAEVSPKKQPGQAFKSQPIANHSTSRQFWSEAELPADQLNHASNRGLTDSKPVKINRRQLKDLQVGDTVELNIPQLSTRYVATIDDIVEHGNGDLSWRGHLTEYEDPYAVIITMGKSAHFATIATPEGAFLLEAADGSGWMVALEDLENLIDTNLQDYQIPDIQR